MAHQLTSEGYYNPLPSHDMWAFGLLLLKLLGGDWPQAHPQAVKQGFAATLAYSNFMCHQYPDAYLDQVRCTAAAAAAAEEALMHCSLQTRTFSGGCVHLLCCYIIGQR